MGVQNDADAGKDVHAGRILPLFNAGEIRCVDAGENSEVPSLHLLGFAEFFNALADTDALCLPVAGVHTH